MMDLMPETGEAVVEFGPDDDAERAQRRRVPVGDFLTQLGADHRLVPLAAALGGVALFGSLVSEWQVTQIDGAFFGDGEVGNRPLAAGLPDLGAWGGGYLSGLFLLAATVVLTLFGPAAGRRYARLGALSVGGVLLAMVLAQLSYLGDTSVLVGQLSATNLDDDQLIVERGRGIWCAAAGVALVLLAMVLAGRHLAAGPAQVAEGDDEEPVIAAGTPSWSWRRPAGPVDDPPDAPFDLTVTPAQPFASSPDNRDKPS